MLKKPTDELDAMLEHVKPGHINTYLRDNRKYMAEGEKAFCHYFKEVLKEKNIRLKDVYSFAGISESYGGQIVRMEKHTTDRDLIILLCLVGHFSWDETSRALKLYGMNELYAKDPRDACLIVAINNRKYDLFEVDDLLEKNGFKKISRDEKSEEDTE